MSFSAKEVLVIDMANQSNNHPSTTTFSLNEIDLLELEQRIIRYITDFKNALSACFHTLCYF